MEQSIVELSILRGFDDNRHPIPLSPTTGSGFSSPSSIPTFLTHICPAPKRVLGPHADHPTVPPAPDTPAVSYCGAGPGASVVEQTCTSNDRETHRGGIRYSKRADRVGHQHQRDRENYSVPGSAFHQLSQQCMNIETESLAVGVSLSTKSCRP